MASWALGENFVKTILKSLKAKRSKSLKIVSDQVSCITTTESLSKIIITLLKKKSNNEKLPTHLHSSGQASWYQIALTVKKISEDKNFINSEILLEPVSSKEYKSLCPRPKYSLLNIRETEKILGVKSKPWEKELRDIIRKIQKNKIL